MGLLSGAAAVAREKPSRSAALVALSKYRKWVKKRTEKARADRIERQQALAQKETKPKKEETYGEAGREIKETVKRRRRSQREQLAEVMKDL